jgi:transposase
MRSRRCSRRSHPNRRAPVRPWLTGTFCVLKTGIQWKEPPPVMGCGCGITCWRRLRDWRQAGVWDELHAVLLDRLSEADQVDWSRASLDLAAAPAPMRPKGAAVEGPNLTDRDKQGTKHPLVGNGDGTPLAAVLSGANRNAFKIHPAFLSSGWAMICCKQLQRLR